MKTLNVNGQNVKMDVHFGTNLTNKPVNTEFQVSVSIEGKIYENAFTGFCNFNKKTFKTSISYTCNKTGLKFGDSEKKCLEHIIALNN